MKPSVRYDVEAAQAIAVASVLAAPPAWVRLEPQSITGNPRAGLAAAVHDPLWALLRQWQFGEFAGEDAGTPLSATVRFRSANVDGFAPGEGGTARRIDEGTILDPLVEATPTVPSARARADAGLQLLALVRSGGGDTAAMRSACVFSAAEIEAAPGAVQALLRRAPDGGRAAILLDSPAAPSWIGSPEEGEVKAWQLWWQAQTVASESSWVRDRLEYRFRVGARGDLEQSFAAPEHLGGRIDWWSVDAAPELDLPPRPSGVPLRGRGLDGWEPNGHHDPQRRDPERRAFRSVGTQRTALVAPLRFAGMPADRLFEFEDARVNLGAMDIQINDPARLALVEFATVYGGDWFHVPIDVAAGSWTVIDRLQVRDSFGEVTIIRRAADIPGAARFCMFSVNDGEDAVLDGLLHLPAATLTLEGGALESVHFVRDDLANMGWAVEETVEGADGRARSRRDEPSVLIAAAESMDDADGRWLLETPVPLNWIPLVAIPDGHGHYTLRKGTMTGNDDSVGQILAGGGVSILDAELPRDGLRVQRVPSLARSPAGKLLRWVAMRTRPGPGPRVGTLASDTVV